MQLENTRRPSHVKLVLEDLMLSDKLRVTLALS